MKKMAVALGFFGVLAMGMTAYAWASDAPLASGTAFAAARETNESDAMRVIPYPNGLDTTTEGASSAPAEINHSDSPFFAGLDFYTNN